MVNKTSHALIAAIFSIAAGAGMAWAQNDAPAQTPAQTPAEAPAEAPVAEAGTETVAPAAEGEIQPGQSYVKETFGDWTMRCVKTPDDKDPCELYQLLHDSDGGAVAEASVVPVQGQVAAIVTFVAPLETDLQHGLRLQVDTNETMVYPFMVCAQVGCISRVGLNDAEIGSFKRGKAASLTLLPFGGQEDQSVKLAMSLSGFTAGVDAVTKVMEDLTAADAAAGATPDAAAPAAE